MPVFMQLTSRSVLCLKMTDSWVPNCLCANVRTSVCVCVCVDTATGPSECMLLKIITGDCTARFIHGMGVISTSRYKITHTHSQVGSSGALICCLMLCTCLYVWWSAHRRHYHYSLGTAFWTNPKQVQMVYLWNIYTFWLPGEIHWYISGGVFCSEVRARALELTNVRELIRGNGKSSPCFICMMGVEKNKKRRPKKFSQ